MNKGIDNVMNYRKLLEGKRLGLITSISGVDNKLRSTIDILKSNFNLVALYGPEHGVRGDKEAGGIVEDYIDERTNIPVYSLYRKDSKRLSKVMLEQVDAVVFDIQDLGVRYYTFIATMIYALRDCKLHNKELIILDRPNPLGGEHVEGILLKNEYNSFVGPYSLTARYGLTIGELANMVNEEEKIHCNLSIIPCSGWERKMSYYDTEQIWIMPSLAMPHVNTAYLYVGTCLVEGTNLSEGRGTACPFEIIGAPYVNGVKVVEELRKLSLAGVAFTPAYFTPTSSKYKDVFCQGVHIHITNYKEYESFKTAIYLLEIIKDLYSNDFQYLPPVKEGGNSFASLLFGDNTLVGNNWTAEDLCERAKKESDLFKVRKEKYHIYS